MNNNYIYYIIYIYFFINIIIIHVLSHLKIELIVNDTVELWLLLLSNNTLVSHISDLHSQV